MIKCVKGEMTLDGNITHIIAELACLTRCVAECVCEHDNEKFTADFKIIINDAIALGFGEKTEEEVFGTDDDDIESMIDDIIEALVKARK